MSRKGATRTGYMESIRLLFPELEGEARFDVMLRLLTIAASAGSDDAWDRAERYRVATLILAAASRFAAALAVVHERRRNPPS